jgi:hypothetical protein
VLAGRARIVESDGRDVTGHYQLAAWLALSAAREAGCQAALLTDGSPPAAVSLSMTVPFADGAKRAPAWPPAARPRHHGIFRRANPAVARLDGRGSRMMIQCKRVYDPQESSDGYRVLVDRLWPRGLKKRRWPVMSGVNR